MIEETGVLGDGGPPLVCGRAGVDCDMSGIGGGEIVILGGSVLYVEAGLLCDFPFRDPFENIFRPAGSVETGR